MHLCNNNNNNNIKDSLILNFIKGSSHINPSVTQGDLNEINGADRRVFKFLEVKLHLFLLIPIKQSKIVRLY